MNNLHRKLIWRMDMKVFRDLAWFFKQEKKAYLSGIFMLFLVAILQLLPPRVIGIVADEIGARTLTLGKLGLWIAVLVVAGLLMYVFRYYWRIYIFGASVKLARILRTRLYE